MARAQGFEPQLSEPESDVLPLDDARIFNCSHINLIGRDCQGKLGNIRGILNLQVYY